MNAQQLQALIALNAAKIAALNDMIDDHKVQAAHDFRKGNDAFGIAELAQATKLRRGTPMRKAVALQRELKAELASIHREARIARKIAKLADLVDMTGIDKLTSFEQEECLDRLITMFITPKADTRKTAAKAAA